MRQKGKPFAFAALEGGEDGELKGGYALVRLIKESGYPLGTTRSKSGQAPICFHGGRWKIPRIGNGAWVKNGQIPIANPRWERYGTELVRRKNMSQKVERRGKPAALPKETMAIYQNHARL